MNRAGTVLIGLIVLILWVRAGSAGYIDEVLADAPLAYYRLNETSGTDAVDAANAHDGTYEGGVTLGQSGPRPVDGFLGFEADNAAPLFDGTDDKVGLPLGFLPTGNDARTIEGWFNPEAGADVQTFFTYGPNDAGGRVSITATDSSVAVSGHNYGRSDLSLSPGWHYAAVVLPDGATQSDEWLLYLDGAPLTGFANPTGVSSRSFRA